MKSTKDSRVLADKQLLAGLLDHLPKGIVFVIAGKKLTPSQVVSLLQARLDATQAASAAKVAWLNSVKEEKAKLAETTSVVAAVRQILLTTLGPTSNLLPHFGIAPRKTRTTQTVEEKAQAVAKLKATREARHTMGARQKAKIKGNLIAPTAAPPAVTTSGDGDLTTTTANGSTPKTTNGAPAPQPPSTTTP